MQKKHSHILVFALLLVFISVGGFLYYKVGNLSSTQASNVDTEGQMITSNYMEYSDENLKNATLNDGSAVLFFATNWCSTCTELDRELKDETEKLSDGITILKIDFDKSNDLKKKYNVLVQHSLVQVDEKGDEIAKWIGGDIDQINKEVR